MCGKELSQRISDDYRNHALTISQIARKNGVCIRTVYNVMQGKTNRKGHAKQHRRYLALTQHEAHVLLSCLQQSQTAPDIQCRLNNIIEDLTY